MKSYIPKYILIEDSVWNEPLSVHTRQQLPHIKTIIFKAPLENSIQELSLSRGKDVLVLASYQGRFLKPCPGTQDSLCCGYFVLNTASNCNFDCTYCFLQEYLNTNVLIQYANLSDMFHELSEIFALHHALPFRIGTGELSDSLSLDALTGFSKLIIPFFAKQKHAILELKTKSNNIKNLEHLDHQNRTIISWSLTPHRMAQKEELKTATLDERIQAAKTCQSWGYKIAFHLEPLLFYPEWENDYKEMIDQLYSEVKAENVAWFSLGGLRFAPALKPTVSKRFPKSTVLLGEFIPGPDGKMRYLKTIRIDLYQKISKWIRAYHEKVPVYLCMEPQDVWEKGLSTDFKEVDEVDTYLNQGAGLE